MPDCAHPAIASVTAGQMAAVDRVVTNEVGVTLVQMMELAGRAVAGLARARFLAGDPRDRRVVVLAGSGGNGGGGLVAARRLNGWCAVVEVWLSRASSALTGAAAHQATALAALGVPLRGPEERADLGPADLVIDALVGYRLAGALSGRAAELAEAANAHPAPVLSLDVPSGLDATTGDVGDPCVRATATLTLALPKRGLWAVGAREVTGELYLADIGIPEAVYARLGLTVGPIFAREEILRIG